MNQRNIATLLLNSAHDPFETWRKKIFGDVLTQVPLLCNPWKQDCSGRLAM